MERRPAFADLPPGDCTTTTDFTIGGSSAGSRLAVARRAPSRSGPAVAVTGGSP